MPYAAADVERASGNLEHGDCYRGCFVGEKIVVARMCIEKGGGVACEALYCELLYLRILGASDCRNC